MKYLLIIWAICMIIAIIWQYDKKLSFDKQATYLFFVAVLSPIYVLSLILGAKKIKEDKDEWKR